MKTVKILLSLVCCFGVVLASDDQDMPEEESAARIRNTYIHIDLGSGPYPLPIPSLALGVRNQWGHNGLDVSLYASTVVYITQAKVTPSYLFYFFPGLESQFYVGGGLGVSALFQSRKHYDQAVMCLSPEIIIGREYKTDLGLRKFFQAQISFPTYVFGRLKTLSMKHHVVQFPLVVLTYGIGF